MSRLSVGFGVCLLWLGGCRVLDARVHNLDALHESDGRHRYTADIMGESEFVFRRALSGLLNRFEKEEETGADKIDDPTVECVEHLLELGELSSDDPEVLAAQVELFAKLSESDRWRLSRERCVFELGRLGARLPLAKVVARDRQLGPTGPEELAEALLEITGALKATLAAPTDTSATAELEKACARVSALSLDIAGGARALRGLRTMTRVSQNLQAAWPVYELRRELTRELAHEALTRALDDRDAFVRAAAVHAQVSAFGPGVLGGLLDRSLREGDQIPALVALFEEIERHGLEPHEGLSTEETRVREARLARLYAFAGEYPHGQVRIAAMGALARAGPAPVKSLREEDWQDWWLARNATLNPAAAVPAGGPRP